MFMKPLIKNSVYLTLNFDALWPTFKKAKNSGSHQISMRRLEVNPVPASINIAKLLEARISGLN